MEERTQVCPVRHCTPEISAEGMSTQSTCRQAEASSSKPTTPQAWRLTLCARDSQERTLRYLAHPHTRENTHPSDLVIEGDGSSNKEEEKEVEYEEVELLHEVERGGLGVKDGADHLSLGSGVARANHHGDDGQRGGHLREQGGEKRTKGEVQRRRVWQRGAGYGSRGNAERRAMKADREWKAQHVLVKASQ